MSKSELHQKVNKPPEIQTKDLYTTNDIKKVRELLLEEQDHKCKLTGTPITPREAVTDHAHDSEQLVRGVLHRQGNAVLGKIENLWVRYLAYWYKGTLQDFLRQVADFLDKPQDRRFRHVGWIRKVQIEFNKCTAKQQNTVLDKLGAGKGSNPAERKKLFKKAVMQRQHGFLVIKEILERSRE